MIAQPLPGPMTPADFDRYALLPENQDRLLGFIAGEIVEVVSSPLSSNFAAIMSAFSIDDMLDGGSVLSGFTLALKDIFRTPPAS